MRVHEIAKAVGCDNATVLSDLGIDSKTGAHMSDVEDGLAQDYIDSKKDKAAVVEGSGTDKVVRFWSPSASLHVCSRNTDDMVFERHVFECLEGSEQDKILSTPGQRDSLRVFKVIRKPHGDVEKRMEFRLFINEQIWTGSDRSEGPSMSGRDSVQRMLPADMLALLSSDVKNPPESLAKEVVNRISLNVENYPLERAGM